MNRVTAQRERARTEATRNAEFAHELVDAVDWLAAGMQTLPVDCVAQAMVLRATLDELVKMRANAQAHADHHHARATAITDALLAAGRVSAPRADVFGPDTLFEGQPR